jgi:hypothetical protein
MAVLGVWHMTLQRLTHRAINAIKLHQQKIDIFAYGVKVFPPPNLFIKEPQIETLP